MMIYIKKTVILIFDAIFSPKILLVLKFVYCQQYFISLSLFLFCHKRTHTPTLFFFFPNPNLNKHTFDLAKATEANTNNAFEKDCYQMKTNQCGTMGQFILILTKFNTLSLCLSLFLSLFLSLCLFLSLLLSIKYTKNI